MVDGNLTDVIWGVHDLDNRTIDVGYPAVKRNLIPSLSFLWVRYVAGVNTILENENCNNKEKDRNTVRLRKKVYMDQMEIEDRCLFPDAWLMSALALTHDQVSAWKEDGQPLPERAWEGLQFLMSRGGTNMSKDRTSDDPLRCTYSKTLDCMLDRVDSKTATDQIGSRSFRVRMPFDWIDYRNNQMQSAKSR